MLKTAVVCAFALLILLDLSTSVHADAEEDEEVEDFRINTAKDVAEDNVTCADYKQHCKQSFADVLKAYCELVLKGFLCDNLKEGEGIKKLYHEAQDFIKRNMEQELAKKVDE